MLSKDVYQCLYGNYKYDPVKTFRESQLIKKNISI